MLISNVKLRSIIVKFAIGRYFEWLDAAVVQDFIEFHQLRYGQNTSNKRAPLALHINS